MTDIVIKRIRVNLKSLKSEYMYKIKESQRELIKLLFITIISTKF